MTARWKNRIIKLFSMLFGFLFSLCATATESVLYCTDEAFSRSELYLYSDHGDWKNMFNPNSRFVLKVSPSSHSAYISFGGVLSFD